MKDFYTKTASFQLLMVSRGSDFYLKAIKSRSKGIKVSISKFHTNINDYDPAQNDALAKKIGNTAIQRPYKGTVFRIWNYSSI